MTDINAERPGGVDEKKRRTLGLFAGLPLVFFGGKNPTDHVESKQTSNSEHSFRQKIALRLVEFADDPERASSVFETLALLFETRACQDIATALGGSYKASTDRFVLPGSTPTEYTQCLSEVRNHQYESLSQILSKALAIARELSDELTTAGETTLKFSWSKKLLIDTDEANKLVASLLPDGYSLDSTDAEEVAFNRMPSEIRDLLYPKTEVGTSSVQEFIYPDSSMADQDPQQAIANFSQVKKDVEEFVAYYRRTRGLSGPLPAEVYLAYFIHRNAGNLRRSFTDATVFFKALCRMNDKDGKHIQSMLYINPDYGYPLYEERCRWMLENVQDNFSAIIPFNRLGMAYEWSTGKPIQPAEGNLEAFDPERNEFEPFGMRMRELSLINEVGIYHDFRTFKHIVTPVSVDQQWLL